MCTIFCLYTGTTKINEKPHETHVLLCPICSDVFTMVISVSRSCVCGTVRGQLANNSVARTNGKGVIALHHLNRTQEAIECFREAIKFQPDFVDAHVNLGDALNAIKKPEEACHAYRDAARLRPIPEIYMRLARALRESGDLTAAEQSIHQILGMDQKHLPALLELGRVRILCKQYPEAIAVFREALNVDAKCKEAHEQIGYLEISQGNIEAAVRSYETILEFSPADTGTRLLIIRLLASQGFMNKAENTCRQGLESNPEDIALLSELGKTLSEQGKKEEAVEYFRKANTLDPSNQEIEYLLSGLSGDKNAHISKQGYIRKVFDGYADSFDTHLQTNLEYHIPKLLAQLIEDTGLMARQDLNIIDLGCGTGLCGPLFKNAAANLVGVDLSSRMLEKARARNIYDELHEADIIDALEHATHIYDLILAADVFVYVGDLAPVFAGCAKTLHEGGLFAFSVESLEDCKYLLRSSGRYGHSLRYIQELAEEHRFDMHVVREAIIRKEGQQPIAGHVFVLKKRI